ncbi:MAG: NPCBM/NEW2 domain-containing protein, partial [Phycisphaerales bacterium]
LDEVVEQDRLSAEQQAAEQARREAEAHKEGIRRAAEAALERFREQERLRQEELAYREHLARRRQLAVSVLTAAILLVCTVLIWISRWQSEAPTPPAPWTPVLPPVVARITRSSQAQWAQSDFSTARGTQLTASAMSLVQGLVELTFDGGADVLVQAPAMLRLEDTDQMFLRGGAVAVTVAEGSSGFVVRTPTGTVVDYGTEFGVLVNHRGETEALVYKGKVGLRSGSDPVRSVTSMMLTEGQAGAVDATGSVVPRAFRPGQVVRQISKTPSFGIPGRRLDLSDVIGGGNGFGTGRAGAAISPVDGRQVEFLESDRSGPRLYVPVSWHRYIDGVFVPDGEASRVVSSDGHIFDACPATNNIYNMEITNIGDASCGQQLLDGLAYGSAGWPCILMHANLGITFDLAEIALANPGSQVARFSAGFGVSESATDRPCNADFWVLVDGEIRFNRPGVKRKGMAGQMDVALAEGDRFLTLITTDGGDPDGPAAPHRATDSDWCVFAEPVLELVPAMDAAAAGEPTGSTRN